MFPGSANPILHIKHLDLKKKKKIILPLYHSELNWRALRIA